MCRKLLLMTLFLLSMATLSHAFTSKQIISENFGLLPMTIGVYETVISQFAGNDPIKALKLFNEMGEQQFAIINQIRGDKNQELTFKKQMLATSIAALAYIELLTYDKNISSHIRQACNDHMPAFVNMFGTSCVELGAVKRPKNNKLNVAQLQKEIYVPIAMQLVKYLQSR